jgi:hypothetical protein
MERKTKNKVVKEVMILNVSVVKVGEGREQDWWPDESRSM